jgi:hypothetical protein
MPGVLAAVHGVLAAVVALGRMLVLNLSAYSAHQTPTLNVFLVSETNSFSLLPNVFIPFLAQCL